MIIKNELYRKSVHILLLLAPALYYFLGKWQSLLIFTPLTTIFITIDYLRRKNLSLNNKFIKILSPILRESELQGDKLCGASWAGLAICIIFFLFKPEIAITAFIILAISDALASLIGKSFVSEPFFEKTLAGSTAFFVSGFIILISCGLAFDVKIWFYIFGIFALFCTTMLEARPSIFNIDDNFIIPITFAVVMTFFDLVWNYSY